MVEEMEKMSRDLAKREFPLPCVANPYTASHSIILISLTFFVKGYKNVQLQMTQLSTLPESIANLESTIASLRAKQVTNMDTSDPTKLSSSQNLPLPATLSLLSEREAELAALNRQLATLQNTLPRKTREAETLERELGVLERRKIEATAQAREAQRKKQEGESDGLEEMGRWYRGAEETLKKVVGVGS